MNSRHLAHDELLLAVVDAADLDAERQNHLKTCPDCRSDRARLEECFLRLGRLAQNFSPAPSRPFRLPSARASATAWGFKPMWAMGLVAAMLLAILIGRSWWPPSAPAPLPTAAALEADRQLTEAVDALVEDALPVTFQRLASLDEEQDPAAPEIDEELIDWVVPPIEKNDDSLT